MTINQKKLKSFLGIFFEDIFYGKYEEPDDCPLPPSDGRYSKWRYADIP